ncbi:MAG TPA: polyprenyl synthetase family protein [Flavobacteriales bacterium]|nr:polyprenyl synthetase family protein [Flavobacteriales bacterium]
MQRYKELVEARVGEWCAALPANDLYAPMAYLLRLPAKRVRPISVLMACEVFGGKVEDAFDEALGIELFHNFTLMHDDIMDASPLRRGDPTVHVKWNTNTAILSGDALLVKAYQLMGRNKEVLALFNRYAQEVCEGQQLDMDFEKRDDVRAEDYMEMIRLKTAVLLSCALQVGATIAGAAQEDRARIGAFGEQLGLAFQLRDDLLDAFGNPASTGKQRGGDLRAGKKTWLLLRGLELEREQGGSVLQGQLQRPTADRDAHAMISALEQNGAKQAAEQEIAEHEAKAIAQLDALQAAAERKVGLRGMAEALMGRKS